MIQTTKFVSNQVKSFRKFSEHTWVQVQNVLCRTNRIVTMVARIYNRAQRAPTKLRCLTWKRIRRSLTCSSPRPTTRSSTCLLRMLSLFTTLRNVINSKFSDTTSVDAKKLSETNAPIERKRLRRLRRRTTTLVVVPLTTR